MNRGETMGWNRKRQYRVELNTGSNTLHYNIEAAELRTVLYRLATNYIEQGYASSKEQRLGYINLMIRIDSIHELQSQK
jgi:hypothetical protein